MTVYGAIIAAVSRKISTFVAEVRKLVAEATVIEKKVIATAKADVESVLAATKRAISNIEVDATNRQTALKNDLVEKIAKL